MSCVLLFRNHLEAWLHVKQKTMEYMLHDREYAIVQCVNQLLIIGLQMSLTEENDVQVIVMESPSPASSAISSSSSTTDSDSASEHEPAALENIEEEEDQEARTPLEVDEEEDVENEESNVVIFRRDLPGLSRSSSPLEIKEGRCSGDEYPLSQRVYSSPTCGISTGLQRQCCDLWGQFDTIGTEMIVTRRGR